MIAGLVLFLAAQAAAPAPAAGKPKLVVMPLQSSALPAPAAAVLDDLLTEAVRRLGKHVVIGKSDIDAMLGLENMKDRLGCDDVACAAEIGGALGVELLLAGRVAKLGNSIIVILTLIDTQRQQVLGSVKQKAVDDENFYDRVIEDAVLELFGVKAKAASDQREQSIGLLRFGGSPAGATILLDGTVAGTTPTTIPVSAGAEHVVRVQAAGFLPREEKVTLLPSETRVLDLALEESLFGRAGWTAQVEAGVRYVHVGTLEAHYARQYETRVAHVSPSGWSLGFDATMLDGPTVGGTRLGGQEYMLAVGHSTRGRFTLTPWMRLGASHLEGTAKDMETGSILTKHAGWGLGLYADLEARVALADVLSLGVTVGSGGIPPFSEGIKTLAHPTFLGQVFLDLHQPQSRVDGKVSDAPWWFWTLWVAEAAIGAVAVPLVH